VAWLWSVVQLLVLPWIAFYVAMTAGMMLIFANSAAAGGAGINSTITKWMEWLPLLLTSLWFLLSVAAAILSAWWARRCLQQQFRYQATLSYQPVKANWSPPVPPAIVPPRLA
jgi:hypothetical protein